MLRSSCTDLFCKRDVLKNFAQFAGNTCTGVSFLMLQTFRKMFKNTYFVKNLISERNFMTLNVPL